MGRSVRIPKEKLLQTGMEMIRRDGYSSINITSLAREAGCSTQPVAWHFGNMENFRRELAVYVHDYVHEKLFFDAGDPLLSFLHRGKVLIDMAFDEPKLVSFIRLSESGTRFSDGIGFIFENSGNSELAAAIADKFGISEEDAAALMRDAMIYNHGLSTLISTGVMSCEREKVYRMLTDFGIVYLVGLGVPKSIAEKAFGV